MSYASIIQDHLTWLATVEGDDAPVTNAVRERGNLAFVLTLNEDAQGSEDTEVGTYEQAGRAITGFTQPDVVLRVADVIAFEGTRWRVIGVDPERSVGGEIACYNVQLAQLE